MKTTTRIDGFTLTDWTQPALGELPWHDHGAPSLSLVLAGRYEESFRGRQLECRRFDVVVKPASESHSDRIGIDGARCLLVELSSVASLPTWSRHLDEPRVHRDPLLRSLVWRSQRELRSGDTWAPLALEGLVLELIVQVARGEEESARRHHRPPWLDRALEYLADAVGSTVRLADVAVASGVHPAHLSRAFRRHLGCSVGEYVRRLRVERAVAELVSGEARLAEIARRAGFYDQSHLHRVVKRHTGLTPAQLRNSSGAGGRAGRANGEVAGQRGLRSVAARAVARGAAGPAPPLDDPPRGDVGI